MKLRKENRELTKLECVRSYPTVRSYPMLPVTPYPWPGFIWDDRVHVFGVIMFVSLTHLKPGASQVSTQYFCPTNSVLQGFFRYRHIGPKMSRKNNGVDIFNGKYEIPAPECFSLEGQFFFNTFWDPLYSNKNLHPVYHFRNYDVDVDKFVYNFPQK